MEDKEDVIDMNVQYTGLEYNDIVFVDNVSELHKIGVLSEVRVDTDEVSDFEEESKYNLMFPNQYQINCQKSKELKNETK